MTSLICFTHEQTKIVDSSYFTVVVPSLITKYVLMQKIINGASCANLHPKGLSIVKRETDNED